MKELTVLVVAETERECADVIGALADEPDLHVNGPVSGLEALRYCTAQVPSAALVHANLRDLTGAELCQLLRGRKQTERLPILVFDTRGDTREHSGATYADDYVSAADVANIVGRIRRIVQRNTAVQPLKLVDIYEGRRLVANFIRVSVVVDGKSVDFTRRELDFLRYLVTYTNHVLTRKDILLNVWQGANDGRSRTIDTHIRRLRMKLGRCGAQIQTLPGIGYRFNEE